MRSSILSNLATVLLLSGGAVAYPQPFTSRSDGSEILPLPRVADTSHASDALVHFLGAYFDIKSLKRAGEWATYFDPTEGVYGDVGLGQVFQMPNLTSVIGQFVAAWGPESVSYPLRIIGDMDSAIVMFVDTPDMFGDELRIITSLDFKNGKVLRQVDHWNARRNGASVNRVTAADYPRNFKQSIVTAKPNPTIQHVVDQLSAALNQGNGTLAAGLVSPDAILEDFSLQARIEGRRAISRYLNRALSSVPYGVGSSVLHVVGNAQGGGYEWIGSEGRNGITSIELDGHGLITRLSTNWDAFDVSDDNIRALTLLSIEP